MRTLLVAILTVVSMNAMASECNLVLKVKTEKAKNAKLDGVSFSSKQLEALKTVCNIEIETMNREELIADAVKSIDKKLAKKSK